MKGAIMQPYFFPYIGYYQLAYEVDRYVFLDDVTFIKQGYINRNSIILQGRRHDFSIPVLNISSYRNINDHEYSGDFSKLLKLIESSYRKAPFFSLVMPLVEEVVRDPDNNVARKNAKSLTAVFSYLGLEREYLFSSDVALDRGLKGQDRILALCHKLGVDRYRNAIGGQGLYDADAFTASEIELKFIKTNIRPYSQSKGDFVPHLSIIDILMYCDKPSVLGQISDYFLV